MHKELLKIAGIRHEDPEINPFTAATAVLIANLYAWKTGLEVRGHIPATGSALIFANHPSELDPLVMIYAAANSVSSDTTTPKIKSNRVEKPLGRLVHGLGKSTLFGIPEPTSIKQITGKKDIFNSDNPFIQSIIKHTIGKFLRSIGIRPIIRGTNDTVAQELISSYLARGEIVASSIIQSRDETGGLTSIKTGPAKLVLDHPDVPVILAAISNNPHVVNIGEPLTGAELIRTKGGHALNELLDLRQNQVDSRDPHFRRLFILGLRELTMILADGIMDLNTESHRNYWITTGRQEVFEKIHNKHQKPLN